MNRFKKDLETQTLRMQFFCLQPTYANYCEIRDNKKLRIEQGDSYDIWEKAVLATYWGVWVTRGELPESLGDANSLETQKRNHVIAFIRAEKNLLGKFKIKPTGIGLDRVWYLFFATGKSKYLNLAFETSGNCYITPTLQDTAIDMFQAVQTKYNDKIRETRESSPDYFETCGYTQPLLAVDAFTALDKIINNKKIILNNAGYNPRVHSLEDASKLVSFGDSPKEAPKETDNKLKEARAVFEDIVGKLRL